MKIYSRADWHAEAPAGGFDHQDPDQAREVFIHHSDSEGTGVHTFAGACALVRSIQRFHIHGRGWSDIGYHFVVVQNANRGGRAWVFACRPLDAVPAAQLDHNSNTIAICIVQRGAEPLLVNTRWRVGRLARRFRSARRLRGHYEVTQTDCPGAVIRAQLDAIARIAGKTR